MCWPWGSHVSNQDLALPNFLELRSCEVRRIYLPRTPVNRGMKEEPRRYAPALLTLVPFSSEGLVAATGEAADLRRSSAGWTR